MLVKFSEFMAAIRKGELPHVFLLSGEEPYYIDKAKEALLGKLFPGGAGMADALQKVSGDMAIEDLLASIEAAPFFADKNVILIAGTNLFRESKSPADTKEVEALVRQFGDMPPYSYLIFVAPYKADKRRKLYKALAKEGLVLESEPLRAWNIQDWLQGKLQAIHKQMDRDAYAYFAGAVSMMQQISLSYLDKEFDKLALFSKAPRITKAELIAVFSGLPEVSVFALLDAISARDGKKALMLLHRQLRWHVLHRAAGTPDAPRASALAGQGAHGEGRARPGACQAAGAQPVHRREAWTGGRWLPGARAEARDAAAHRCRLPLEDGAGGQ